MFNDLLGDIRYALRGLISRPLFTLIAVASLALGIGVNSAIHSLFATVLLRPLPVPQPERLVNLAAPGPNTGWVSSSSIGGDDHVFSYAMFRDLERAGAPLDLAGHRDLYANIAWQGRTSSGEGALVSGGYFAALRLTPALGRLLGPADDAAVGGARVVVLSHAYWQNTLGGRTDVLGSSLRVNGEPLTIVGVAPAGFTGTSIGQRPQVFVPLSLRWQLQPTADGGPENRQSHWVYAFARLHEGVTVEAAGAALNALYQRLLRDIELPQLQGQDEAWRQRFAEKRIQLESGARGQSTTPDAARRPLLIMAAVAALVLLIACLNVANLLLARGALRTSETALRASLGASRMRLLRQGLVEALLLAWLGGLASLPLAALTLHGLSGLLSFGVDAAELFRIDPYWLAGTAALATATVLIFGLLPAWQGSNSRPLQALKAGSGGSGGARHANRFRVALATAQIALSLAALVIAGLFLRSLTNLAQVDLGMQVQSVAQFRIAPGLNGIAEPRWNPLYDEIEQALRALPGVTGVTTSMVPLLANGRWGSNVSVEGWPADEKMDSSPYYNAVGPDFLHTLGIPLLAGREFTAADRLGAPKVAIVNRRFAEQFRLGTNPVGKRMAIGERTPDIEIVGLIPDSHYSGVRDTPPAQFMLPRLQMRQQLDSMSFYVRSSAPPEQLLAQLKKAVAAIEPDLPVDSLRTLPQQVQENLATERLIGRLTTAFALLATALAALGLYGVLNYTLNQRLREIGLRLALGAAPQAVRRMLLAQVGRITLIGAVLGLAGALLLGRAAESLLYGLTAYDPTVLLGACMLLALVAVAAGLPPARRAARIEPMVALRYE